MYGRVLTVRNTGSRGFHSLPGAALKPKTAKTGYYVVNLTQRIGRKNLVTVPIHTLVAFAFLGTPPTPYGRKKGCCVVHHIDGDKLNNIATNLRWKKRAE